MRRFDGATPLRRPGCVALSQRLTKSYHPEGDAVDDGAAKGDLVGILKVVADGDAARYGGDLEVGKLLELTVDIYICRVTLHRGGQRQDDLLCLLGGHAVDELADSEVADAYAVEGRDDAAEDVIKAVVTAGVFDGHNLLDVLYNADYLLVTLGAGADGTQGRVADAMAAAAIVRVALEAREGADECREVAVAGVEEMEGVAQRGTLADTRQGGDFVDSCFEYF